MNKSTKSLIYINFSPYTNAGRILDWLISEFPLLVVFSFDFHRLSNKHRSNYIDIYRNHQKVKSVELYRLPTPEALLFITLPIITLLIAVQTFWHIVFLRRTYGKFDYYLTVNAFTAWLGNIFRAFRMVDKTIFWVWDYFPPGYPDWPIRLARSVYWQFDRQASNKSSSTIYLNQRLFKLRQKIGVLERAINYPVVPIGTNPAKIKQNKNIIIGHFGVLKKSQGLDLLFGSLPTLLKKFPNLKVEIVGSGPDESYFKEKVKSFNNVHITCFRYS